MSLYRAIEKVKARKGRVKIMEYCINDITKELSISRYRIKKAIKEIYPAVIQNGKKTKLNLEQYEKVKNLVLYHQKEVIVFYNKQAEKLYHEVIKELELENNYLSIGNRLLLSRACSEYTRIQEKEEALKNNGDVECSVNKVGAEYKFISPDYTILQSSTKTMVNIIKTLGLNHIRQIKKKKGINKLLDKIN